MASDLSSHQLIGSYWLFRLLVELGPTHGYIPAGPYLIQPGSNLYQIADMMVKGKIAIVKLTFPEGLTNDQLADRWASSGLGSKDEFTAATHQTYDFSFLNDTQPAGNLEGYLFPSTYQVAIGAAPATLVQKMLNAFQTQVWPLLQGSRPQNLTPNQVLTLASMVEKEANTTSDRKLVAGVFYNRLRAGMKLESDVTVNYATGKNTTSASDILVDSPYNTYKIDGLPPAPIDNPGLDSIQAALQPTPSDYFYFIADGQGVVHFAKTIGEHNANIKKYL